MKFIVPIFAGIITWVWSMGVLIQYCTIHFNGPWWEFPLLVTAWAFAALLGVAAYEAAEKIMQSLSSSQSEP